MELQYLVALIKELHPNLKCKYVRGEDYCTFLGIEESEPRVNSLTPSGENHSIAGSYLEKLANCIDPYSPFNISQLMNNSGSNRPIIETIVAHTAEFYWVQIDRARYVVWIPGHRHEPGELIEWTDIERLENLRNNYTEKLLRQRDKRFSSLNNQYIDNYIDLLLAKHNLVLTGAPGTGKTFTAKAIAASIISDGKTDWCGLSAEQKKQVAFVQFHPSYDYTDFVEGLRPFAGGEFRRQDGVFKEFCKRALSIDSVFDVSYRELIQDVSTGKFNLDSSNKYLVVKDDKLLVRSDDGRNASDEKKSINIENVLYLFRYFIQYPEQIGKCTKEGCSKLIEDSPLKGKYFDSYGLAVLKEILERSRPKIHNGHPSSPFIFIIDEINRGELSKIFGELFYAIEPDYRGEEGRVQTQYNNLVEDDDIFKSGFYVPENVYIIGTMNDVDRGVEAMDFAIRRRFGWKEVTAEESADNMGITGLARVKMDALNKALIEKGLTKAHCIGGAYFRKLEGDDFKALWDYHLEGIIFEYFRGEPDVQSKIDDIKKAYDDAALPEQAPEKEESTSTEETSAE